MAASLEAVRYGLVTIRGKSPETDTLRAAALAKQEWKAAPALSYSLRGQGVIRGAEPRVAKAVGQNEPRCDRSTARIFCNSGGPAKIERGPATCSRALPCKSFEPIGRHVRIVRVTLQDFVGDSKETVSAGILPVSSPGFLSLWTSAVSRADFWPPVSASKNSVPGSLISRGKGPFGGLEIGDSGRQKCRFEPWP
jgi:hypothetical protein